MASISWIRAITSLIFSSIGSPPRGFRQPQRIKAFYKNPKRHARRTGGSSARNVRHHLDDKRRVRITLSWYNFELI